MSPSTFRVYSGSIVHILLAFAFTGVASLTLSVTKNLTGILGHNPIDIACTYVAETRNGFPDVVTSIAWQKKLDNRSTDNIATFWPPNINIAASFANTIPGNDLKGRAELSNPSKTLSSAVLRINEVKCEDEAEYQCVVNFVGSGGSTTATAETRMIVKGRPELPDTGPIMKPSKSIVENTDVNFTCSGIVGLPSGKFVWQKFRNNNLISEYNASSSNKQLINGSCTYNETSTLTLRLTKEDNLSIIRCTIYQELVGNVTFRQTSLIYVSSIGDDRLRCLSCVDRVQPRHCHYVDICKPDEICMTEKVITATGDIKFNVGCKEKSSCNAYVFDPTNSNSQPLKSTTSDGRVLSVLCRECCKGNLCNSKGCGETGYPQDRGPICFNCVQTRNPSSCDKISVCNQNEGCHIEKKIEFGDLLYTSRCLRRDFCSYGTAGVNAIGKRDVNELQSCRSCCFTDLCNGQCVSPKPTKATQSQAITSPTTSYNPRITHTGTEFLFIFLQNYNWAENVTLLVTSTEDNTTLDISSPFTKVTRNVSFDNNSLIISLPKLLPAHDTGKENKGVLLNSTKPVSVYGFNFFKCCSVEGFAVFPIDKLGTFYKVVTYNPNRYHGSLIGITTLDFNTTVTVQFNTTRPFQYYKYYKSGDRLNFTLNRLQSFQIQHTGDLTGTTVQSNRPIAVLSGNGCANLKPSTCSHLVEYLPPVSQWGTEYIIPPIKSTDTMILRIMPSIPNTNISIYGEGNIVTSETLEKSLEASRAHAVSCDNPCLVVQYRHGDDIYSYMGYMSLIPSLKHFSNNYLISKAPFTYYINITVNYVTITIKLEDLSGLRYDGKEIFHFNYRHDFVFFKNDWSVITMDISEGSHRITHISPNVTFGVNQYGISPQGTYGFPSGLSFN